MINIMKKKNYPISQPSITELEIEYVNKAVKSGWVSSLGKYIIDFEKEFAAFCGVQYALATNNGTTAIHLVLASLGIGDGDEVIVPDLTFVATANGVSYTSAKPIIVDIEANNLCIDPEQIRKAITSKTKAIMPVHIYGHPADMDSINAIAKEFGLYVIEDAAEAHGALYKGKKVGGLSDCGVFSFYGNKIITTGEGGMLTTNSKELYDRAKFLRDHAMSPTKRYWHPEIGYNYRITNLQAALGLAQLHRIEEILSHRKHLIKWYKKYLNTSSSVRLNFESEWAQSSYWLICVEIDALDRAKREILMDKLREEGVDTRPYFYAITDMPMYQSIFKNPVSKSKSEIGLNLPTYFDLDETDVEKICKIINSNIDNL
jgi:perosamine synthetase